MECVKLRCTSLIKSIAGEGMLYSRILILYRAMAKADVRRDVTAIAVATPASNRNGNPKSSAGWGREGRTKIMVQYVDCPWDLFRCLQ